MSLNDLLDSLKSDEKRAMESALKGDWERAHKLRDPDPKVKEKARKTPPSKKTPLQKTADKLQASRGGKSLTQYAQEDQRSYVSRVAQARAALGVTAGSPEDDAVKNGLIIRYGSDRITAAQFSEFLNDMRTNPGKVRRELESFRKEKYGAKDSERKFTQQGGWEGLPFTQEAFDIAQNTGATYVEGKDGSAIDLREAISMLPAARRESPVISEEDQAIRQANIPTDRFQGAAYDDNVLRQTLSPIEYQNRKIEQFRERGQELGQMVFPQKARYGPVGGFLGMAVDELASLPGRVPQNLEKLVTGGIPLEERVYALVETALDLSLGTGQAFAQAGKGVKSFKKFLNTDFMASINKLDLTASQKATIVQGAREVVEEAGDDFTKIASKVSDKPVNVTFRKPATPEVLSDASDVGATFRPKQAVDAPVVEEIPKQKPVQKPKVKTANVVEDTVDENGFGMTHAETAEMRAKADIAEYVKTTRPLKEVVEKSRSINARSLAESVIAKPRALADHEHAAVVIAAHANKEQRGTLLKNLAKSVDDGDISKAAELSTRLDELSDDMQKFIEASDLSGSEAGRSLGIRKLEVANLDDTDTLRYRYYKAAGKKPDAKYDGILNEIDTLRGKLYEAEKRIEDLELGKAEKIATRLKSPTINYRRSVSKSDYESAIKTWKSGGVKQSKTRGAAMSFTPEQWRALKTVAKYHFESGVDKVADIVNKVVEVTGVDNLLATRAVREALSDAAKSTNQGRAHFGEDILVKGSNALESKEVRSLRFEFDRKLKEANHYLKETEKLVEYNQKSWGGKALHWVMDATNSTRSVLASGDMSASGRQGLFLSLAQPKVAAKAFKRQLDSITKDGFDKVMWEISQNQHFNEAVSSGLEISDALGRHEEIFVGNLVKKIPVAKQWTDVSEQTYTAFLNSLRMDTFSMYVDSLEAAGKKLSRDDLKSLADFVNIATGRGVSKSLSSGATAQVASQVLFAPRFLISRLQYLTGVPLFKATKATRGLIAKEYAKAVLPVAATIALFSLNGMAEADPRSSRFGKIQIGNQLYDISGGMGVYAAFLSRVGAWMASSVDKDMAVRKTWDGKYSKRTDVFSDPVAMTGQFIKNKLAPVPGAAIRGIGGKDYKGDPTNLGQEFGRTLSPIGITSAKERKDSGLTPEEQILGAIAEFFGFGTSDATIKPPKKPKKKAKVGY